MQNSENSVQIVIFLEHLEQLRCRLQYCTEELLLLRGPSQHSLERGGLLPLLLLSDFLLFSGNAVSTLLCTVIKLQCPCYSNHNWGAHQSVLNDLLMTRLSRRRMIWLLPHHLLPPPVSKLEQRHTGRLRKRDNPW
jgi:hypothetical protein